MEATGQTEALVPQPLDAEAVRRRQQLEDVHEELLLTVMALEAEWLLDDRIAFSLRQH
jgi:non-ribosomal peptide synthetase component F